MLPSRLALSVEYDVIWTVSLDPSAFVKPSTNLSTDSSQPKNKFDSVPLWKIIPLSLVDSGVKLKPAPNSKIVSLITVFTALYVVVVPVIVTLPFIKVSPSTIKLPEISWLPLIKDVVTWAVDIVAVVKVAEDGVVEPIIVLSMNGNVNDPVTSKSPPTLVSGNAILLSLFIKIYLKISLSFTGFQGLWLWFDIYNNTYTFFL